VVVGTVAVVVGGAVVVADAVAVGEAVVVAGGVVVVAVGAASMLTICGVAAPVNP